MTGTTHAEFNDKTEALEVAQALAESVRGKTIVVTGVNQGGIGFTTAEAFVTHLIVASRTPLKMQESINALKSKFPDVDYRALEIDLCSQQSVRKAAAELLSWEDVPAVDILVNSAAIMNIPERTINDDGIEIQFATNHIGHFLFTNLILPKLIKAANASRVKGATRVINVASASPTMATMRWSDLNFEKLNKDLPAYEQPNYDMLRHWGFKDPEDQSYLPLEGYNQSKIANVLFGIGLTERLFSRYGILGLALHPGVIQTELGRSAPPHVMAAIMNMAEEGTYTWKSQAAGASTTLVAALDPKLGPPESREGKKENFGAFLWDCQISDLALPPAVSSAEADKMWKISEGLVKETFVW
ncbi:uncharacterized protein JN550_013629 [Neoarthrinium moseri]|uniref:uncharacterized protein n=1 Tax=Neoarthrinium moseri TaxID=1658444 RepID=UPI001FDB0861|nr:uncharacterized protein JN550_013629 [Neoarthrinium moseri]KAI1856884.1 hypothetical protein JN550_013629 [Neoarthrinium moseri]